MPDQILTPAEATVQQDNERVRIVRWHFAPGTETGWHRHGHDYIVVPSISGTLTMINPDGSLHEAQMIAGVSYFRQIGVEHNVVNLSDTPVEFVEIELK
ncbi:cupin domain-containing protein [Rhizobium sp. CF142]|uniref:cupin domain-containing protein n=1 Tax=Rhizobium sp. CF142 TaxID=1144314 RepID=UPI00026F0091|nr:cupin domain-containing protein [Rhizobium sp. CF142]EJJ29829.1 cupin domain-containing protein [Rhizobium sp. CF142]